MPRQNDGAELFKALDQLQIFRQVSGGGNTTSAASASAQSTALNFTATTNFTAADPIIIIGAGGTELNAITATTPTTAVPLLYKLGSGQASGASIVEAVGASLAHITEDGVDFGGTQPINPIFSALASAPINYLYGNAEFEGAFTLLGFNVANLHTWLGITEAETGAGTSGDPYMGVVTGLLMGTQGVQCMRATGRRFDKNIIVDFQDVKIAPAGTAKLNRATPSGFPCTFKCTGYRALIWT